MTTQLEIPAVSYRIKTPKGTMALSSLRPGDHLSSPNIGHLTVMINSAKLQLLVVRWDYGLERSYGYRTFWDCVFIGHGKRRAYWKFLPKWLRKRVCEYGRPKP